ncbi:MAG: DUF5615 family PIN-like protein [Anaerolineae bacterium]
MKPYARPIPNFIKAYPGATPVADTSSMKVRFQADAGFNQIIVKAVLRREPSVDIQTAMAINLKGVDDIDVLGLAAKVGRVLVTHDRKTMPKHFAEFITSQTSTGLYYSAKIGYQIGYRRFTAGVDCD